MTHLPYEKQMSKTAQAWNEVTPIHQSYRKGQETFFRNGGCQLDKLEIGHLPNLVGLKVAHLCCNCGQDTLSLANLGANCTGFDFSELAIEEARKLAKASGIQAEFVHSNVLDIPPSFHGMFDLVYISKGVLVWLPDLKLLMNNVAALLREGGRLLLYDQHPFICMIDNDDLSQPYLKLSSDSDYFDQDPQQWYGLDYIGGSEYEASPNYQFKVSLSDLLNGMTEHGLQLVEFLEFEHSMYPHFANMEQKEDGLYYFPENSTYPRVPIMMLVKAVKT